MLGHWSGEHIVIARWYLYSNGIVNNDINMKLDGVGPVDNRPSSDKLHHFVQKKKKKKKKKHVTYDM